MSILLLFFHSVAIVHLFYYDGIAQHPPEHKEKKTEDEAWPKTFFLVILLFFFCLYE